MNQNMFDTYKMQSVQDKFVSGTCMLMCPLAEMSMRERHGLLCKYEVIEGTESLKRPKVNRKKAVKEYRRPAAGREDPIPSDLRPSNILLKTTYYLIDNICNMEKQPASRIYEFVFDRLRAVRQDMVIQNLQDTNVVQLLECCVRFHIYFQYELCDSAPREYNQKINSTHLQECLKRLLCLYRLSDICCCHKEEILSYYLLFNLGDADAVQLALEHKVTSNESLNTDFSLAVSISLAWLNCNYARVFKLADSLSSPLYLCALHSHIGSIHSNALKIMASGYNSKHLGYAIADLTKQLHFDSNTNCKEICQQFGLQLKDETSVLFSKANFTEVILPPQKYKWINVKLEDKKVCSLLKNNKCRCVHIKTDARSKSN